MKTSRWIGFVVALLLAWVSALALTAPAPAFAQCRVNCITPSPIPPSPTPIPPKPTPIPPTPVPPTPVPPTPIPPTPIPPTPILPSPTPIPPSPTPTVKEKDPLDTPTATTTFTITPTPTQTGTPTPSRTPSRTPTRTPTAVLIATATDTPLPAATSTETPTSTPSNTPTSTPTNTPTTTPTPVATSLTLNEFMPHPASGEQWIELFNSGTLTVAVSGWQLQVVTANGTQSYVIPASSVIAPRGFLTFFKDQTQLDLHSAGEVRLLFPASGVADGLQYNIPTNDQSAARNGDGSGAWTTQCVPTPNTSNCVALVKAPTSTPVPAVVVESSFFRDHIQSPLNATTISESRPLSKMLSVLGTNLLLALILALAVGTFSSVLNDTLEAHEDEVSRMLGPVHLLAVQSRQFTTQLDRRLQALRLAWLSFVVALAVILVLYGVVFAYLDPSFDVTRKDSWLLVLALALSLGLIGIVDDIAQFFFLRWRGEHAAIRVHAGNIVLAAFSTLVSRMSGLAPGILAGSPAGLEDVRDTKFEMHLHFLALAAVAVAALAAWAISPLVSADGWLTTLMLLIFAVGVQTTFFELLPLRELHGRSIFQYNKWLWGALFAIAATVFFQTMLNPDGEFIRAFDQQNMVTLAIVVILFCLFATGVWVYFNRRRPAKIV